MATQSRSTVTVSCLCTFCCGKKVTPYVRRQHAIRFRNPVQKKLRFEDDALPMTVDDSELFSMTVDDFEVNCLDEVV